MALLLLIVGGHLQAGAPSDEPAQVASWLLHLSALLQRSLVFGSREGLVFWVGK